MFRKVLKSSFVPLLVLAWIVTAAFTLSALVDAHDAGVRIRHGIVAAPHS
jgi:hypothetical protein